MPELNSTPELLAAGLAILALRATIGESTPLNTDRVRLGSESSSLSSDAVALLFASRPKPLVCDAEARDGVLIVHWWPLSESSPNEQQFHERRQHEDEKRGGFMPYLEDHYGAGDHLIAALGRGESLFVPHSVVNQWSCDYEIRGMNCAGDDVANPLAVDRREYIEARERGAKGVLRFKSQEQRGVEFFSSIALYSESSLELPKEAEEHLVEMARSSRMLLQTLIAQNSSNDPPPPRSSWAGWYRKALEAQHTRLARTATMMKTVFKNKSTPSDVALFVDECDKYFGSQP